MGTVAKAQYDEATRTLKLLEPLEGFHTGQTVDVLVNDQIDPTRPWMALENSLVGEDGERFEKAIEEAFPIER